MIDTLLHTGAEHPSLLWVLLPAFLTFVAGLGLGANLDRIRRWMAGTADPAAE